VKTEDVKEEEVEETEPTEPKIDKGCFRAGGQVYYGDYKAGYRERKGTILRHGFGRQVELGVAPAGKVFTDQMAWETVITGQYEGNWVDDTMTGQGNYKWSDGSTYEGNFQDGQPSGHGRFTWPDGSAYEGSWSSGAISGQGRFESRFDGKTIVGRHSRNCYQSASGKCVDYLEKLRKEEHDRILRGDVSGLQVRRCPVGEYLSSPQSEAGEAEKNALVKAILAVQSDDLVPFVVAEDNLPRSAFDCLEATGFADPATHCASLRLAAIARRRRRDCQHYFFDAIQSSMRTGDFFVMAFEDDDEGCGLLGDERREWYKRPPAPTVPREEVPEDWKLAGFFEDATFPAYVLQPTLFNGRGLARFFLEDEEADSVAQEGVVPTPNPIEGAEGGDEAPPAESSAQGAALASGARAKAARTLVERAAEGTVGGQGIVGPSTWFWEVAPGEPTPQQAGLPLTPLLRPVLTAHGRTPAGLEESAVESLLVGRFGRQVPMHRTVILLLSLQNEPPELN